ncbi:MAG: ribbon-helix-helix domain-containing protein [Halobacteriaceae archaeon]
MMADTDDTNQDDQEQQMVSFQISGDLADMIEEAVEKGGYSTYSDLYREAVREKCRSLEIVSA